VTRADLREAARILAASILKVLVFNKDHRGARTAEDERLFAEIARALACSVLALHEKSNMQGLLDMGANPAWLPGYVSTSDESAIADLEKDWCVALRDLEPGSSDIAELLREKKIKVAIVLGEDPLGSDDFPRDLLDGLFAAQFLLVADLFPTATAALANVVLPLCSPAETSGTSTNSERRVQRLTRAIPAPSGMETWEILREIAAEMGYRFKMKYSSVDEVTDEIMRVVPIYRDVVVDGIDADGIWDLTRFPIAPVKPDVAHLGRSVQPVATLALDHLESRFSTWFDGAFARARQALVSTLPVLHGLRAG